MHITSKSQATRWTWKTLLGAALAPLLLASGCQTNTGTGLLAGGALGALAGGAIGAGASEDHHEHQQAINAQQRRALALQDVVDLTRSGTSDQIIMNQINTSGIAYHLTGAQIQWLHDNGVHDPVIETLQATATRPPPVYIQERPEVVYVAPAPPP